MKALGVFYSAHLYYKILVRIPLLSLYKIKHYYSFIKEIKQLCKKRTLVSLCIIYWMKLKFPTNFKTHLQNFEISRKFENRHLIFQISRKF